MDRRKPGRPAASQDATEPLRRRIVETFRPVLDPSRPAALVDFQDSKNSGDHAIWLGEKALLRELGVSVVYECSAVTYDREAMAAALGDGVILINGGGNFGDTYGDYHRFKLKLLADFPDNPVVLFPQTVMFFADVALRETAAAIAAHGDVTLTARDLLSEHILKSALGDSARVLLAPDMACMLGPLKRHGAPRFDIAWIRRVDGEAVKPIDEEWGSLSGFPVNEISLGPFKDGIEVSAHADIDPGRLLASDWYRINMRGEGCLKAYGKLSLDDRAQFWLDRALRLISAGRVVVTDRLHGHILCTLAGVPHVLINNSYGKNFGYFENWSRPSRLCLLAKDWSHGQMLAERMVKRINVLKAKIAETADAAAEA